MSYGYEGGGMAAPQEHPKAQQILIMGIVGLVCCTPVGIAAWVMGNNLLKEMDASGIQYSNRNLANIGRILGIVATVVGVLGLLFWLLTVGVLAGSN